MTDDAFVSDLKSEAARLGFADCRIARADSIPEASGRLRQWLSEGCHGEMAWMANRAEQRASPVALWPDAASAIMLGMSYAPADDPRALADAHDRGRISVYAQGADYHDTIKKGLKALARWMNARIEAPLKIFVDTAPVMEKPLAAAAGLGWQGKHSNLVSRRHGNWLFLGAILTSLDLQPDPPQRDLCGSCDACQRVCPTDAFPAPYRLDARRCISYLTIELKAPIPEDLRPGIGNHVYGCDDCLAVCPWNKFAEQASAHRAFLPRADLVAPALSDLLPLDDAGFREMFAGSPIKRIGRGRLVRNAAVAAGNSGDAAFLPALSRLVDDGDPVVADAAQWAIGRISGA